MLADGKRDRSAGTDDLVGKLDAGGRCANDQHAALRQVVEGTARLEDVVGDPVAQA